MKNWETLKLYKNGKKLAIPDDFVAFEHGGDYFFTLCARFKDIKDAENFAKMKSKKGESFQMYTVTKNLSGDVLGEYYVYYVLKRLNPDMKMSELIEFFGM